MSKLEKLHKRARITKIRHLGKVTEIEFDVDADRYKFTCEDPPHEHFRNAFIDLGPDIAALCELNKGEGWQEENPVIPYQVVITRKADARRFAITAKRALKNSNEVLVINAPARWDDSTDYSLCFNESTVDKLNRLEEEARMYLAGKRGQMELFEGGTADVQKVERTEEDVSEATEPITKPDPVLSLRKRDSELTARYGDEPPSPQDTEGRLDYYESVVDELSSREAPLNGEVAELTAAFRSWRDGYGAALDGKQFTRAQAIGKRLTELKAYVSEEH